ncbi:MAG TPA: helix-turn-helix domain-containing protein [Solirubrobacterales bacterium]|nr:helix-turn-helix domain-containing protein [Solirubrobacterales bacterium]
MQRASREREGTAIAAALRDRRGEIEQAILARAQALSEPPPRGGAEYAEGLRAAVSAGLEYGIEGIERGDQDPAPVPEALLAQARLAARFGVSLDTVLRRYFAGHTLLEDFMVQEAERSESLDPAELKRLLRSQAAVVERLLATVSEAYAEELGRYRMSPADRRAERVERLLAGEPLDTAELGYDLEAHHLALLASGPGASEAIVSLARSLDARALSVRRPEGVIWAWLGARSRIEAAQAETLASRELPEGLTLAIGEPGEGIGGWRQSHRQARAALTVALRSGERVVRYAGVALLASALQDELLQAALRELYLAPLEAERDGGEALRRTLRAYFAAGRNVSSAAAAIGLSRQTIKNRLQVIEERVGASLGARGAELELALALESIDFARKSPSDLPN